MAKLSASARYSAIVKLKRYGLKSTKQPFGCSDNTECSHEKQLFKRFLGICAYIFRTIHILASVIVPAYSISRALDRSRENLTILFSVPNPHKYTMLISSCTQFSKRILFGWLQYFPFRMTCGHGQRKGLTIELRSAAQLFCSTLN